MCARFKGFISLTLRCFICSWILSSFSSVRCCACLEYLSCCIVVSLCQLSLLVPRSLSLPPLTLHSSSCLAFSFPATFFSSFVRLQEKISRVHESIRSPKGAVGRGWGGQRVRGIKVGKREVRIVLFFQFRGRFQGLYLIKAIII